MINYIFILSNIKYQINKQESWTQQVNEYNLNIYIFIYLINKFVIIIVY